MILEGLVTTVGPSGAMHLAAMGPHVDDAEAEGFAAGSGISRLVLRPFATSQTGDNLLRLGQGVFHVTDDVLLVVQVVTGQAAAQPFRSASRVRGGVLVNACRGYEFEVVSADTSGERLRFECRVVAVHEGRPFLGFNRARHAVVEAAILVTRLHLLGAAAVRQQMAALVPLVEKTGGPREHQAFRLLEAFVERA